MRTTPHSTPIRSLLASLLAGVARARRTARAPALACGVLLAGGGAASAGPGVGDPAPDFALPGTDGEIHRLADSVGKRGLVLAWFPKAFTPG